MKEVQGKVAFITGGASGIGLGMARAFLRAGMKVIITYRSEAHLALARSCLSFAQDRVLTLELEVTDRIAMLRAADEAEREFGSVDVLCNNAGVGIMVPASDASFGDWDWAIDVNIGGVVNGIQTFLPRMRARGGAAHILSTASMGGLFVSGGAGIYNVTKYAVVGMMEALRSDLIGTDIGVSVLCPGLVNTDIHLSEVSRPAQYAECGRGSSEVDRLSRAVWFKEKILSAGMCPFELGERALDGIRRNDLYILTHPEYADGLRERFDAILAAMPREVEAPAARILAEARVVRNAMYVAERNRSNK